MYENQRRGLIALLVTLALALVVALGWLAARPLLDRWRHRQALAQADHFAAEKDYRNLLLSLQRATQIAPGDIATWQRVADSLEQLGLSDAVLARENIVRLSPADLDARLQLAAAALRFGQPAAGLDALKDASSSPARQAEVERLSAELARALGDEAAFARHLRALLALAPDDSAARFNLAVLDLQSGTPADRSAALATLESLLDDPAMRVRAALQLLGDAARTADADRAGAVVRLLITRLPHPAVSAARDEWQQLVASLQQAATLGSAADVSLVARWFGSVRRGAETLAWLDTLPESTRSAATVRACTAELAAQANDFTRLAPLLLSNAWGAAPADSVTLALAARAQQLRRADERARATWNDAIAAAQDSASGLRVLVRLAQQWRQPEAAEAALRALVQLQPKAFWAYAALRDSYAARDASGDLLALLAKWQAEDPANSEPAAAWIELAAILDRVTPAVETRAAVLAETVPHSAAATLATAALAWRHGEFQRAAETLRTLSPTDAATPEAAFWSALVWAELGDRNRAEVAANRLKSAPLSADKKMLLHAAFAHLQSPPGGSAAGTAK